MSHDDSTEIPSNVPYQPPDDGETGGRRERRKRYPGILSKVVAGTPENAALAVLKGELALPVPNVSETETDSEAAEEPDLS